MPVDEARLRPIALFVLLALFLLGAGGSLANSTDAVYATVIQDAAVRGDWLTPGVAGAPYLMKPLGWFWAGAASVTLLGESAFAYRLPNLLLGWLTVWLAAALGERLAGRRAAWWWTLGLALLAPTFVEFTRRVYMEVPLAATQLGILLAAAKAIDEDDPRSLAWVGPLTAAGVLTKSYAGGFAPTAVLLYLALFGPRRWLVGKHWLGGIAAGSAVLGVWLATMLTVAPDEFVHQMTAPFRISSDAQYSWYLTEPWFYLTAPLAKDTLPFAGGLVALGFFARRAWAERAANMPLLVGLYGLLLVGIFAQLSHQRLYYLVPLFPALAAVAGAALAELKPSPPTVRIAGGGLAALALLLNAPTWTDEVTDPSPAMRELGERVDDALPDGATVYRYNDFFASTELYLGRRAVQLTPSDVLLADLSRLIGLGERGIAADGKPPAVYALYRDHRQRGEPFVAVFDTQDLVRFLPGLPGLVAWQSVDDLWLVSDRPPPTPGPALPAPAKVGFDVAAAWHEAEGRPAEAAALRAAGARAPAAPAP